MSFSLCDDCGTWAASRETMLVLALLGAAPSYLIARFRVWLQG